MRKDILERMKLMKKEQESVNYSELARRYDCDYRTIKKYFQGVEGEDKQRKKKESKLTSYKGIIDQKYDTGCTAMAVYCFIKKKGFDGSYSIVKRYCHRRRNEETKKATIRFETNPGLQAQVDWKEKVTMFTRSGEAVEINIFLMLLGFSRMKYLELTLDKSQSTLFACMINALEYFEGVPKEIIFDNMRTVVDQGRSNYQNAVINDKFYQFSKDMGFEVWACRVYRPQTKGKVEALAKLMSRLEPYNYEFNNIEELSEIVHSFNEDLNREISQATYKIPFNLWQKEKEYLLALPNQELLDGYFQQPITRTVSKESMITYKYNKYSLNPQYIGKTVSLEVEKNNLKIFYNNILIATHEISGKKFNYKLEDYVSILKSDAFKFKKDEEINEYAKKALAIYDAI